MRDKNRGSHRALAAAIVSCMLFSGFVAPISAAAENAQTNTGSVLTDSEPAKRDAKEASISTYASDQDVSAITGVTLGTGFKAKTDYTWLDQSSMKRDALNAVIKWRKDALNDSRIKFQLTDSSGKIVWKTVPEYLKATGISQQEYLSPKWSNALERIAIQRALEAYTYADGHERPDGNSCFEAEYNGLGSYAEILAWGTRNIADAVDLWASEKSDYIKEVNGSSHSITGHYTTLIDPEYGSYGFAGGFEGSSTYSGEAVPRYMYSQYSDESPTGLKGTGLFEISVSQDKVNQGLTWKGLRWAGSDIEPGGSIQALALLSYNNGRYYLTGGNWTSSNTAVATVNSSGMVRGIKHGRTTIKVTAGSKSVGGQIRVTTTLERVAGATRYDTMASIDGYVTLAQGKPLIVASGTNYPDALAASGLAGALNGAIALTDSKSLSSQVVNVINMAKPNSIIIAGGPDAVSSNVEQQLRQYCSNVKRYYGVDRYETSLALYRAGKELGVKWNAKTALLTTGDNYADALSASSYAYAAKMPIFLCSSKTGFSQSELEGINEFQDRLVIGGKNAVPEWIATSQLGGTARRVSGATRYETSIAVAKEASGFLGLEHVVFATGENFPDALAAGPFAGRNKAFLLLADPSGSTASFVKQYLNQHGAVDRAYVVGGENAISRNLANSLADALDMKHPSTY